jgi:hypothetical protein
MITRYYITEDGMQEDESGEFVKVEDVLLALGKEQPEPAAPPPPVRVRVVLIGEGNHTIYGASLEHGQATMFDAPVFGVKQICVEIFEQ